MKVRICACCACLMLVAVIHSATAEEAVLRIGLMPAFNSIPLVVADEAGLFRARGLTVRLVPFNGQLERESALQAGALDGTVSDLINAIQSWSHGSSARVASVTEGNFCLLAAPSSRLRSLADWPSGKGPGIRTGLLENSIVYYLTERMLIRAGADAGRLELVPIVQLPARAEMLLAGKVDAACLPEPLATFAVARGARILADSDGMGTTPGVLLFTGPALSAKKGQIRAFYQCYDAAVDELRAHPDRYRDAIVTRCGFPPQIAGSMRLPGFRHSFLPSEALVADVASWMVRKGLTDRVPTYADIVQADSGAGEGKAGGEGASPQ